MDSSEITAIIEFLDKTMMHVEVHECEVCQQALARYRTGNELIGDMARTRRGLLAIQEAHK